MSPRQNLSTLLQSLTLAKFWALIAACNVSSTCQRKFIFLRLIHFSTGVYPPSISAAARQVKRLKK